MHLSRNITQEIAYCAFCLNPTLMSIATFDESIYLDVNDSFLCTLGFNRDEVIGHNCSELGILSLARQKRIKEMLLRQGKLRNLELKYTAKTGMEVPGLLSADLIRPHDEELLLMVFHDISERIKMEEELEEKNRELHELNKALQRQAITDSLTGLYNHRQILDRLRIEIARADRYRHALTIMMLDIDHFKKINDEFGHQAGDAVLEKVARTIKSSLRNIDIAGRYGGEEFLIILPQTNLKEGLQAAERIRRQVEGMSVEAAREGITVSIGISQHQGEKMEDFIARADRLLYQAKGEGRNRIES